jgi:hypothetical protein
MAAMDIPDAVRSLERDLRDIFNGRFRSLVMYQADCDDRIDTLALVDDVSPADLRACATRVAGWHDAGLATPLVLAAHEFDRSLDTFPIEFGDILERHVVVAGVNPFAGLTVSPAHLRQACEVQARSHLLHLREGFVETRGRSDEVAALIRRSAPALAALIRSVGRLQGRGDGSREGLAAAIERDMGAPQGALSRIAALASVTQCAPLSSEEARRILPDYLNAVERLTAYVDQWRTA